MTIPVRVARRRALALMLAGAVSSGCSGAAPSPSSEPDPRSPTGTVRLYTSVTQDTVDAVLAAYAEEAPNVTVEVFRAPTG